MNGRAATTIQTLNSKTRWSGLDVVTCDRTFICLMFIYPTLSASLGQNPAALTALTKC